MQKYLRSECDPWGDSTAETIATRVIPTVNEDNRLSIERRDVGFGSGSNNSALDNSQSSRFLLLFTCSSFVDQAINGCILGFAKAHCEPFPGLPMLLTTSSTCV